LSESTMGIGLQNIAHYMHMAHGNKGMFLFTGTIIDNSIPEIFVHLKNVIPEVMRESFNDNLDDFLNNFTNIESALSPDEAGNPRMIKRLQEFINVPKLRDIMLTTTDIQKRQDMPEFQRRKTKSGKSIEDKDLTDAEREELLNGYSEDPVGLPNVKVVNEVIKKTKVTAEAQKLVGEFYSKILSPSNEDEASMNQMMGFILRLGKLFPTWGATIAGLSPRLKEEPNSKVNVCVRNILKHYREHEKAGQVVFLEEGYDNFGHFGGKTFKKDKVKDKKGKVKEKIVVDKQYDNTYPKYNIAANIVKKLVENGIPEDEIFVMSGDVKDTALREHIAKCVANGDIRVIIGSTSTIGVGVNMQDNLRAAHHFDIPFTPGAKEQEDGRFDRQGNHWNTVYEYRYVNPGFDGKKWSLISFKDMFIKSLMDKNNNDWTINAETLANDASGDDEGGSAVSNLVETFGLAQGDERYVRQQELTNKLNDVTMLKKMMDEQKEKAIMEIPGLTTSVRKSNERLEALKSDAERNDEHHDDKVILYVKATKPDGSELKLGMSKAASERLQGLVDKYKERKKKYEDKIAENEKALEDFAKRAKELPAEIAKLKSELDEINKAIETHKAESATAEAELDAAKKNNSDPKAKKIDTKPIEKKVKDARIALNKSNNEAKTKHNEVVKAESERDAIPVKEINVKETIKKTKENLDELKEPTFYTKEKIDGTEYWAITDKEIAEGNLFSARRAWETELQEAGVSEAKFGKFRDFDLIVAHDPSGKTQFNSTIVRGDTDYVVDSGANINASLRDIQSTLSNFNKKIKDEEKLGEGLKEKLKAKQAQSEQENPWDDLFDKYTNNLEKLQLDIKQNPIPAPEWLKLKAPKGLQIIDGRTWKLLDVAGWSTKDNKLSVVATTGSVLSENDDEDNIIIPIEQVYDESGEKIFSKEDIERSPEDEYIDPEDDSTEDDLEVLREDIQRYFEYDPDFRDWPGGEKKDVTGDKEKKERDKEKANDPTKVGNEVPEEYVTDHTFADEVKQGESQKLSETNKATYGEIEDPKDMSLLTDAGRAAYGSVLSRFDKLNIPSFTKAARSLMSMLISLHAENMAGLISHTFNIPYSPLEYTKTFAIARDDAQTEALGYQVTLVPAPFDYTIKDRAILGINFDAMTEISTAVHEYMHLLEKELYTISRQGNAPKQIKEDWYTVADWLYGDKMRPAGYNQNREKWAQTLQFYLTSDLMSPEIAKLAEGHRQWLLDSIKSDLDRRNEYNTDFTVPEEVLKAIDRFFMYRIENDPDVKHSSAPTASDLYSYKILPKDKLNLSETIMQSLGRSLGVNINYVSAMDAKENRGIFFAGNQIIINRKADVPASRVVFHELTHWIKKNNAPLYEAMRNGLKISPQRIAAYRKQILNGEHIVSDESIIEEMIADAVANSDLRFRVLQEMIDSNISKGKKIAGALLYAWQKIKSKVLEFIGKNDGKNLPAGLNNREISLMDARLKEALCKLKKAGKPVFRNENGTIIDVESGVNAALSPNEVGEVKHSASKPTDSSSVGNIANYAFANLANKLSLKDRFEKAGLSPAENVEVVEPKKEHTPNLFERWFSSPTVLAKKYPRIKFFVDLATKAMEHQERLRAHFTELMNDVDKVVKKDDRTELSKLLLDGDLDRKQYNEDELKSMGYNENVIKGYNMVRQALDEAWRLVNNTRQMAETKFDKSMSKEELEELKKHPFKDILNVKPNGDGTYSASYRQPQMFTRIETLSQKELDDLRKDKNVHIISETKVDNKGIQGDTFYKVKYESQVSPLSKIEGYIPHIFHGYFVMQKIKDADGKVKGYNILKSHDNFREATKIANEFASKNPKEEIVIAPKLFHIPGSAKHAAIMGDTDYKNTMNGLAEDLEISVAEAKKLTSDTISMKNRRRFFGHSLQRKGANGYEKNVMKALRMYFNQASRYSALDEFKRKSITHFEKKYGNFFDDSRRLSKEAVYIRDYINDINGTPTEAEEFLNDIIKQTPILKELISDKINGRPSLAAAHMITYPMAIAKLGLLNFGSAFINLSQLFNVAGALDAGVGKGYHYLKYGMDMYKKAESNPAMMKFLMEDLGLKYSMNMTVSNGYSKAEVANKMLGQSFWLFNKFDGAARAITLFGAYRKALDNGMSRADAIDYAKDINRRVNIDSSVADAPDLFRRSGPAGTVLLQFQKFPVKQLEFFYELARRGYERGGKAGAVKEFVKYTWPYFVASGVYGIPFAGIMFGVLNMFGSAISGDDDFDIEKELKKYGVEKLGKDSALLKSLFYGAGSIVPGIAIGQRIGIGDYGTSLTNSSFTDQQGTHGLIGQVARMTTLGSTFLQAYDQFVQNGNVVEGIRAINPSVGNVLTAVNGEVRTTRGRLKYRYDGPYDRLMRGLGFTPINEKLDSDIKSIEYSDKSKGKQEKMDAIDDFLNAERKGNTAEMRRLVPTLNMLGVKGEDVRKERERRNKTKTELDAQKKPSKNKQKSYSLKDYTS